MGTPKQIVTSAALSISNVQACQRHRVGVSPGNFIDLTGKRFGRWVVVRRASPFGVKRVKWHCVCDCGEQRQVCGSDLNSGHSKSCGCVIADMMRARRGRAHPSWKGGKTTRVGYRLILCHEHPNADKNGYVMEHIKVMSEVLGRPLGNGETVHHKNGVKCDNNINNLELWSGRHSRGQRVRDMLPFCSRYVQEYEETPEDYYWGTRMEMWNHA